MEEQAQYDLGLDQKEFVPVLYANETSWGGEVLKFAPTILIIAVWLYVMRQMCAPRLPSLSAPAMNVALHLRPKRPPARRLTGQGAGAAGPGAAALWAAGGGAGTNSRAPPPPPPPPSYQVDTPRPSTRTNRTRRVPHPVLNVMLICWRAADSNLGE